MRVLQIGAEWPTEHPGGLNTYVYELTNALWRQEVDLKSFVVGSDNIALTTAGRVVAFAKTDANLPTRLWRLRRLALQTVKRQAPEVITAHFALYALPLIDQTSRTPSVVHFHGPWATEGIVEGEGKPTAQAKALLERSVYRKAKRLIVLSQAFKNELTSNYGTDPVRVCVVPGGVDTDRFHINLTRAEARQRLGWPQGKPILVAVRRLVNRMGLDTLIDAAKILSKQVPDFLLCIGGRGPNAKQLASKIEWNGLHDHVRLLGFVSDEDLPLVYRAANLSVVPSQALEGFGLIAAESLAAGTPVLVSPIGGLPEVIRSLASQCIMPAIDAPGIAATLRRALTEPGFLPSEQDCRNHALMNFQWSTVASKVLDVYRSAMQDTSTSQA